MTRPPVRRLAPFFCLLLLALHVAATPSVSSAAVQRVSLRTDDGLVLSATWYEPANRPGPAVVLVHMLQRSRRDWDLVASRLAASGIGALTFDLRGHGESQGTAQDYKAMVQDVKAARRYVGTRADVLPGRVSLAGASLGATLALLAAADDASVRGVALLSPALDYRGLRIDAAARKLGTRPMLLVASDEDPYALRSSRELQKGAGSTRELLILNAAGHGTTMLQRNPDLASVLLDWFRRTLL
jgi:alpha-beta hydrolase superfamily lysophospholipase